MKDKKYKHIEDLIEDYLQLTEEQIEISILVSKAKEKQELFLSENQNATIKTSEAQEGFKVFSQLRKVEDRNKELEAEIAEVETILKDFLQPLTGSRISYEKKDDNKTKITYLFWLDNEQLQLNRY